jgi:hypothetical protein
MIISTFRKIKNFFENQILKFGQTKKRFIYHVFLEFNFDTIEKEFGEEINKIIENEEFKDYKPILFNKSFFIQY